MLPLILGIGAAALLLGRKAVKRVTRSNPRKRRAAKRRRNPVESRFRRAGVNVIEVRRYLDGKIKVRYSDGKSKTFRKARANPVRRRKGKRISPDQAASRLAWWRWHHNPRTRNPGMPKVSSELLADAGLTPTVLKQVQREINGSEREAYAHWMVISERLRQNYRSASGEKTNPRRRRKSRRK